MQYTRPAIERQDSIKGLMTQGSGNFCSSSNKIHFFVRR